MRVLVEGEDNNDDKNILMREEGVEPRELCCVLIGQVLFLALDH